MIFIADFFVFQYEGRINGILKFELCKSIFDYLQKSTNVFFSLSAVDQVSCVKSGVIFQRIVQSLTYFSS